MTFKSLGWHKNQPPAESTQQNVNKTSSHPNAVNTGHTVLALQRQIGNRATNRLLQRAALPPQISHAPANMVQTFRDIAETVDIDIVSINPNLNGTVAAVKDRHTNSDSGLFPHGLGIVGFNPTASVVANWRSPTLPEKSDWEVGFVQYVSGVERNSVYRSKDNAAEYIRSVTLPDPPWFDGDSCDDYPWYERAGAVELPLNGTPVQVTMQDDPFLSFSYKISVGGVPLELVETSGRDSFSTWVTAFNIKTKEKIDLYHIGWQVDYRAVNRGGELEILGKGEITNAGQGPGAREYKFTKTAKGSSFQTDIKSKGLNAKDVEESQKERRTTGAWTNRASTSGSMNVRSRGFLSGNTRTRSNENTGSSSSNSNSKSDQD